MNKILEVKNLKKSYGDFILRDISFSLESGYIMGFIGPNGAGKTTTIKLIMNLLKRDGGEIKVFGLDNINDELQIKEKIGFVYDQSYFYEELSIIEMKRVIAPLYKGWNDQAFSKYLKEFGLSSGKKIKDLSRGMKMKFSLAVALSHDAQLLIMDEPTSGLDPVARNEFLDILASLIQDENKAVLLSSHITSDLDKIADFITLIDNGKILFSIPKDDILDTHGLVKGGRDLLNAETEKDFIAIKMNRFGFEGLVADKHTFAKKYGNQTVIEKPTLEDVMLFYTRRGQNA